MYLNENDIKVPYLWGSRLTLTLDVFKYTKAVTWGSLYPHD